MPNEEKIILHPKGLPPTSKSEKGTNHYAPRSSTDEKTTLKLVSHSLHYKNNMNSDAYFENFLQKDFMEVSNMTSPGVDFNCVIMDYMFDMNNCLQIKAG